MNIGKRIRLLREKRGWTQERLAAKSGVPQATISNIEREKVSPLFESVLKIVFALEIDLNTLTEIQIKKGKRGLEVDATLLWQLENDLSLVETLKNPEIVNLAKQLSSNFPSSKGTSKNNDLKVLLSAANKILEKGK